MNRLYWFLLLFCCAGTLMAQPDENILSYYAVGNSLDGQPLVDMPNRLRFYPVFALREQTDSVYVAVYYGPYKFIRRADKKDGGRYWDVILPDFELGQAIQRFEVETWITFRDHPLMNEYERLIGELGKAIDTLRESLDTTSSPLSKAITYNLAQLSNNVVELQHRTSAAPVEIIGALKGAPLADTSSMSVSTLLCAAEKICRKLDASCTCVDHAVREELIQTIHRLRDVSRMDPNTQYPQGSQFRVDACNDTLIQTALRQGEQRLNQIKNDLNSSMAVFQRDLHGSIRSIIRTQLVEAGDILLKLTAARDSLRERIALENSEMLKDTMFSGPSVRRADIIIDNKLTKARILYRNYKTSLRSMPALDPAENMGIFRLRYIPFIVTGSSYRTTFDGSNGAVFEVGLGFGDVAVSGDDFVKPELSIRRLGVAFAITRELFSDSADIRALALTYDFNSYGSIGIGMNFPRNRRESYFSFGINKQAFEDLLAGIITIFE